jgi:hypothetical protein
MWGAAPRLGRLAVLFALVAGAVFGCVRAAAPAIAAATPNWAAKGSADFDGDHLTDLGGLYRGRDPLDALWYAPGTAGAGPFQIWFGANGDVPVPGDYNGDGKTDAAIFRPSTVLWYGPATGLPLIVVQMILGQAGDVPVPGDYDGDGKTDPAIWRPRTGAWQARLSGGGTYQATNGSSGDIPVPADYNGDRRADPVVFRPSTGSWTGPYSGVGGSFSATLGQSGDVPIPGYYDADLTADPAVFRVSTGTWIAAPSQGGSKRFDGLGVAGDVAIQKRPTLAGGT